MHFFFMPEEEDVNALLRSTVSQLEDALQESQELLAKRDQELRMLREEAEKYKQQVTKEIVSKTKIAQALDESERQARERDILLQQWQLDLRECTQQKERAQKMLLDERQKSSKLAESLSQIREQLNENQKEAEQLKSQLVQLRTKSSPSSSSFSHIVKGKQGMDDVGMEVSHVAFLRQSIYHYLTGYHAEEQVRAIISMLDFTPEERKQVYAKQQERKARGFS